MEQTTDTGRRRDAGALKILGCFFILLGSLVLLANLWAEDNHRAMIVNICSGALLAVIGVGTIFCAYRIGTVAAREKPPIEK